MNDNGNVKESTRSMSREINVNCNIWGLKPTQTVCKGTVVK